MTYNSTLTHRRRAFASFTAVVLLGTTAIALTAVAGVTVREHQRTRDAATDAQLRQLLAAGQQFLATQPIDHAGDIDGHLPVLPDGLGDRRASVQIEMTAQADGPAEATLTATFRDRAAAMSLQYDAEAARWRVTDAQLP